MGRLGTIAAIMVIGICSFSSCKKCKECYLVKTNVSGRSERPVGERCGRDIRALERDQLICVDNECTYECK